MFDAFVRKGKGVHIANDVRDPSSENGIVRSSFRESHDDDHDDEEEDGTASGIGALTVPLVQVSPS